MFALGTALADRGPGVLTSRHSTPSMSAMPGDRQPLLLRNRRLRNWVAMFAVLALLAWVVEFSSHLHVTHEAQASAQGAHFCEMCAAFQAGASATPVAQCIPKLRPEQVREIVAPAHPRLQLVHSYRSRAPPVA